MGHWNDIADYWERARAEAEANPEEADTLPTDPFDSPSYRSLT